MVLHRKACSRASQGRHVRAAFPKPYCRKPVAASASSKLLPATFEVLRATTVSLPPAVGWDAEATATAGTALDKLAEELEQWKNGSVDALCKPQLGTSFELALLQRTTAMA